ncbi:hypothetical protein [Nostoc sp.]|uniref:hypothetical protein n=1 Tax=Nostoc sp. TaxID=1180 RepID=UPI002FF72C96
MELNCSTPTTLRIASYLIHVPLVVFRLVNRQYLLQRGNPVWLAEIGLEIGYEREPIKELPGLVVLA